MPGYVLRHFCIILCVGGMSLWNIWTILNKSKWEWMESRARIFYRHSLGPCLPWAWDIQSPLRLRAQSAATMRDVQRYADIAAAIPRKPLAYTIVWLSLKRNTLDTSPLLILASTELVQRGLRTVASTPWRTRAHTAQCPGRNTRASGHCLQPMYPGEINTITMMGGSADCLQGEKTQNLC